MTEHPPTVGGVSLSKYCELTGDTVQAVKNRVRAGIWRRGVHVTHPTGSRELWVNLAAHRAWLLGQNVPDEKT